MFLFVILCFIAVLIVVAGTVSVVGLLLWLYPVLGSIPLVITGLLLLAVSAMIGLWVLRNFWRVERTKSEGERFRTMMYAVSSSLAVIVTFIGAMLLLKQSAIQLPPSRPGETVARLDDLPQTIVFAGRGELLAAHPDQRRLVRWQADATTRLDDVLAPGRFLAHHRGKYRIFNPAGMALAIVFENSGSVLRPKLSPDGRRIVYELSGFNVPQAQHGLWLRETAEPGNARFLLPGSHAAWSTDGQNIFACQGPRLLRVSLDGQAQVLFEESDRTNAVADPQASPDGESIVFRVSELGADEPIQDRLMLLPVSGGKATRVFSSAVGGSARLPIFSPDGEQIAFIYRPAKKTAAPIHSLAVMNADGSQLQILIDPASGWLLLPQGVVRAAWSPDGTRLAFVAAFAGDSVLMDTSGNVGYSFDLYVIAARDGPPQRLTRLVQDYRTNYTGPLVWLDNGR